jgi:hypothetical protein
MSIPTSLRGLVLPRLGIGLSASFLLAIGCGHSAPPAQPIRTAPAPAGALPVSDPVDFLANCLKRYDQQGIQGYRATFQKQERIHGQLGPLEVIPVAFRASPYSVFMKWLQGARKAQSVLYVEGENDDRMLVHPTGLVGRFVNVVARDPEGAEAREEGFYSIREFGLRKTLERTLKDWKAAKENGTFKAEYLGVQKVRAAGDRSCYTLHRTQEPDARGVTDVTVYIDTETWFQVGTVLEGGHGELIGEYMYRDIQLNPNFKPDRFKPAALTS